MNFPIIEEILCLGIILPVKEGEVYMMKGTRIHLHVITKL
jgi:hypothetical protein